MSSLAELAATAAEQNVLWHVAAAAASGSVEYFVPVLPGDAMVVALGLVNQGVGRLALLWAVATAASTLGGLASYELGRLASSSRRGRRYRERHAAAIEAVEMRFVRYGSAYLALNRFVPGLRAFFFVAAASAGISRRAALGWGFVSSAAWMGLLFGAAVALGESVERLEAGLGTAAAALVGVSLFIVGYFTMVVVRARRGPDDSRGASGDRGEPDA